MIGAVFCVYENSGFLEDAIRRVYDSMEHIVVLLNFQPWQGEPYEEGALDTYRDVSNLFDPDRKIELISGYWPNEGEQRNFGKKLLHQRGIQWCLVIDDDELYSPPALKKVVKSLVTNTNLVLLVPQRVYWKTPEYWIENYSIAFPAFCQTAPNKTVFKYHRNIEVNGGTWETLPVDTLVCHHYSYVRTDDQLKRKLQNFSHANEYPLQEWYDKVWSAWNVDNAGTMINLHPNPANRAAFSKAVPIAKSGGTRLDESGFVKGSYLEKILRKSDFQKKVSLDYSLQTELKSPERYLFLSRLFQVYKPAKVFTTGGFVINAFIKQILPDSSIETGLTNSLSDFDMFYITQQCSPEIANSVFRHLQQSEKPTMVIVESLPKKNPDFLDEIKRSQPFVTFSNWSGFSIVSRNDKGN